MLGAAPALRNRDGAATTRTLRQHHTCPSQPGWRLRAQVWWHRLLKGHAHTRGEGHDGDPWQAWLRAKGKGPRAQGPYPGVKVPLW